MKTKTLSILLTIVMLLSMLTMSAFAAETDITIDGGDMTPAELKAAVTSAINDGKRDFTITGDLTEGQQQAVGNAFYEWCGAPRDGGNANNPAWNEEGNGTVSLTWPDVTVVADSVFGMHSYALKSVVLPNAVKIGMGAFSANRYLETVTAPNVLHIGSSAFNGCKKLHTIDMPKIKTIDSYGFSSCPLNDTSTTFAYLEKIESKAFTSSKVNALTFPRVSAVDSLAFEVTDNITITFETPILSWGSNVFDKKAPESIVLYLSSKQKVLTETDGVWTVADGAATVEFGENKSFCGYTFKEIRAVPTPDLSITGGTAGTDYTYENGVLEIKAAGNYEIKNTDPATATSDIIKVSAPSGTVNITLSGVVINVSGTGGSGTNALAAFEITGNCETVLILKDGTANSFDSGLNRAGIANHAHNLIIACENAEKVNHICSSDCGALRAVGQQESAGIGGDSGESGSNITIAGGNIVAVVISLQAGAGIGGGLHGNGSNITISGGIVTAESIFGAGIGGGDDGNGSNITITGGTVSATSSLGAGIGGGFTGTAENIKIVPAANTQIYAYSGFGNTGEALGGSPFTYITDITGLLRGNAFYSYAEHVHIWGDWLSNNDGTHTRTCVIDANHTEMENCSGGIATCTEKAVCTGCAVAYGEFADHIYGTAWETDGTNHWHECTCGAKTDEAAHSGGIASCEDKAVCEVCAVGYGELAAHTYEKGKCTVCQAADPNYVPDIPKTGDNSHMALWLALLFISGGAIIALTVYDRRRKNHI